MGSWNSITDAPAGSVPSGATLLGWTSLLKVTPESYYVDKGSDQTVNNSATLVNDSDLVLPVVASATYIFECYVAENSGATPDWKAVWSVPSGTTMFFASIGYSAADVFGSFHNTAATTQVSGGSGGDRPYLMRGRVKTSTTAGNLQLQWAQNTANVSDTIVRAGSYLWLVRVA